MRSLGGKREVQGDPGRKDSRWPARATGFHTGNKGSMGVEQGFFFPILIPFISFSCPIGLAETSNCTA